jgi:hypothetical protein
MPHRSFATRRRTLRRGTLDAEQERKWLGDGRPAAQFLLALTSGYRGATGGNGRAWARGGFKNHAARAQGRDIVIAGFELRVAREWRGINASWAGIEAMFQTMVMAVDLKTMVQSTVPNVN